MSVNTQQPEPPHGIRKIVDDFLWATASQLARMDFAGIRKLAPKLGATLWFGLPSRRALAIHNIHLGLGVPQAEARDIARESFNHNALSFLEAVLTPSFGFDHPLLRFEEEARVARFRSVESPIVASTGHLGAWELQAGLLAEFFPDPKRPTMVVVRRNSNAALNNLMVRLRSGRGAEVVGHREAVFTVLRGLRRKGLVAFLVDHNASRSEAVFLPFLGRPAAVNIGPALLAVRAGAEVWPAYLLRQGENYLFCQEDPMLPPQGVDRDAAVRTVAQFYTEAAERFVRRAPEQWFWMHNRWKTQE